MNVSSPSSVKTTVCPSVFPPDPRLDSPVREPLGERLHHLTQATVSSRGDGDHRVTVLERPGLGELLRGAMRAGVHGTGNATGTPPRQGQEAQAGSGPLLPTSTFFCSPLRRAYPDRRNQPAKYCLTTSNTSSFLLEAQRPVPTVTLWLERLEPYWLHTDCENPELSLEGAQLRLEAVCDVEALFRALKGVS